MAIKDTIVNALKSKAVWSGAVAALTALATYVFKVPADQASALQVVLQDQVGPLLTALAGILAVVFRVTAKTDLKTGEPLVK